jgi:hypothetical protein
MTLFLLGILVSMNVYVLKQVRIRTSGLLFSWPTLSVMSSAYGACCSSIGFVIISTFAVIGVIATNFLTVCQVPLRLISIGILLLALYNIINRISKSCIVDYGSPAQAKNKLMD